MRVSPLFAALTAITVAGLTVPSQAEEQTYRLTIKDHKFSPDSLEVPANMKFKLVVKNEDPAPEEFESKQLHREKLIPAGKKATINIDALKPGSYAFVGEYHEDTAKGRVIAK